MGTNWKNWRRCDIGSNWFVIFLWYNEIGDYIMAIKTQIKNDDVLDELLKKYNLELVLEPNKKNEKKEKKNKK